MTTYPIPDQVFEQHSAWLATSGAGKTTAVKGGVERMLARGERVVIIDPTGVWWGLRFLRDGRRASPYELVIFGRHHADLPLEPGSGEIIARALGGARESAILNLKGMSVADRTRFITAFFETLIDTNVGTLNVVIDEVHLFAPQSGGTGLTPAMLHATNNLVSLGRAAGLRIAMISQRPAKVHKDSLTQAKSLVALQCSHPLDQRPIRDWLSTTVTDKSEAAAIMQSLAGLPVGAGWFSAPQMGVLERVRFPMIGTFDSSRPGVEQIPLKPLDLGALRAAMSISSPTNEGEKLDNSTSVSGTKVRPQKMKSTPVDRPANAGELAAAEARGEAQGFERGREAGWKAAIALGLGELKALTAHLADARVDHVAEKDSGSGPTAPPARTNPARARHGDSALVSSAAVSGAADTLSAPHRKVVDAMAWWRFVGIEPVPRARVCIVAGYSPKASTFGVYIAELVAKGLVETSPGAVRLTDAGLQVARTPEGATRQDLHRLARSHLKEAAGRVFDAIYEAAPHAISRANLADRVGLSRTASTLGVYIAEIVGYGLATTSPGTVTAAAWLFL